MDNGKAAGVVICLIIIIFLIIIHSIVFALDFGYNKIMLNKQYDNVKDILRYEEYDYKEFIIGSIKVIQYHNHEVDGLLIFDLFNRLYTIIVTLPVDEQQYAQLYEHFTKKYATFNYDNTKYCCTIGIYRIGLYYNKVTNMVTIEYGHTLPLFTPAEKQAYNPFSKF